MSVGTANCQAASCRNALVPNLHNTACGSLITIATGLWRHVPSGVCDVFRVYQVVADDKETLSCVQAFWVVIGLQLIGSASFMEIGDSIS